MPAQDQTPPADVRTAGEDETPGRDRALTQRDTPYVDAVIRYRELGFVPFHTPGHKIGKGASERLIEAIGLRALQADAVPQAGIEDSRETTGHIREAERLAAEAYGGDEAWFLVNGSTSGVHALALFFGRPDEPLIVPRNSHKSLLAGIVFSGAVPFYVEPDIDPGWQIPLGMTAASVAQATTPSARRDRRVHELAQLLRRRRGSRGHGGGGARRRPALRRRPGVGTAPALLRRSPCRRHGGRRRRRRQQHPQAHRRPHPGLHRGGARGAGEPQAPLRHHQDDAEHQPSGSDLRVHRCLATADGRSRRRALAGRHRAVALGAGAISEIPGMRILGEEILELAGAHEFDPTRYTLTARDVGLSGYELESILRDDYRVAVEMAEPINVMFNITHGDSKESVGTLVDALADIAARFRGKEPSRAARARGGPAVPALHAPGRLAADRLLRGQRRRGHEGRRGPRRRRDPHAVPARDPGSRTRRGGQPGDRRLPPRRRRGRRAGPGRRGRLAADPARRRGVDPARRARGRRRPAVLAPCLEAERATYGSAESTKEGSMKDQGKQGSVWRSRC